MKHFLCQFDGTFHLGAAARDHDAGRDQLFKATAAKLIANQAEELFIAWLDNFSQRLSRQAPRRTLADARDFDRLVRISQLRQRAGILDLDLFGVLQSAYASTPRCRW